MNPVTRRPPPLPHSLFTLGMPLPAPPPSLLPIEPDGPASTSVILPPTIPHRLSDLHTLRSARVLTAPPPQDKLPARRRRWSAPGSPPSASAAPALASSTSSTPTPPQRCGKPPSPHHPRHFGPPGVRHSACPLAQTLRAALTRSDPWAEGGGGGSHSASNGWALNPPPLPVRPCGAGK